jgi:tRNA-dihydrouridine synthase B
VDEVRALLLAHLDDHYRFYGSELGLRTARKHIIWYTKPLAGGADFCARMNAIDDCAAQARAVDAFLRELGARHQRLPYAAREAGATAPALH